LKSSIIALEDSRVNCVGEGLKKSRNHDLHLRFQRVSQRPFPSPESFCS
jgi:hypothetical protein